MTENSHGKVVYKFPLNATANIVELPAGAQVLHVDAQGRGFCLWALVDLNQPPEERRFVVLGTGHMYTGAARLVHISTFLVDDGAFVFHAFEEVTA